MIRYTAVCSGLRIAAEVPNVVIHIELTLLQTTRPNLQYCVVSQTS